MDDYSIVLGINLMDLAKVTLILFTNRMCIVGESGPSMVPLANEKASKASNFQASNFTTGRLTPLILPYLERKPRSS